MISWKEILIRLALAAFFGAAVGVERERKDWAAGLRTHMMVCVGASLTMIVSAFGFQDILGTPNVVLDPSRVAAQVISGIGFIGAGTILFLRQEVIRGLTTAAGLWTVAAIGLATGGGMYFAALVTTVVVIFILWLMKPLERKMFRRYRNHNIRIVTEHETDMLTQIREIFSEEKIELLNLSIEKNDKASTINMRFSNIGSQDGILILVNKLKALPGKTDIFWDKGN
jgi:putative Mg2+ transporter-C (MgtC) family protein